MTETKKATSQTSSKTKNSTPPSMDDILKENFAQDPQFDFTIAWSTIEPTYQKVLTAVAKNLKHDGFRPGKVPTHIAEEMVDSNYLAQEVLREVAPPAYQAALKKEKLTSFVEPELVIKNVAPKTDWILTACLPQKPVIKLPNYKKLLTDEKKKILTKLKKEQETAAAAAKKEKRDFTALTAEQLQAQATDRALFTLLETVKPKISAIMVKRSTQREFERLLEQLKNNNLELDDYLKNTHQTIESISQQLSYSALQNLQLEFILDALLEAEKITATQEEILAKLKETMPDVKDEKEQQRQLSEPSVKNYLELLTKRKKLADWLLKLS